MKVSHAKDGGQAVELEHAGLILAASELVHTYPTCGDISRTWGDGALQILVTLIQADRAQQVTL